MVSLTVSLYVFQFSAGPQCKSHIRLQLNVCGLRELSRKIPLQIVSHLWPSPMSYNKKLNLTWVQTQNTQEISLIFNYFLTRNSWTSWTYCTWQISGNGCNASNWCRFSWNTRWAPIEETSSTCPELILHHKNHSRVAKCLRTHGDNGGLASQKALVSPSPEVDCWDPHMVNPTWICLRGKKHIPHGVPNSGSIGKINIVFSQSKPVVQWLYPSDLFAPSLLRGDSPHTKRAWEEPHLLGRRLEFLGAVPTPKPTIQATFHY